MIGPELRKFRRDQNWNQERLATLLGISKRYLQSIECSPNPAPNHIADGFEILRRGVTAGAIKPDLEEPRRHFQDFHRSVNFSQEPRFATLPMCACGDKRCHLSPIKDGDWDKRHLWKFKGNRCQRVSYVDSRGKVVPIPRELKRDPLLAKKCSLCGRLRQLVTKYRPSLGCRIAILQCVSREGDAPDLEHDAPEKFVIEKGGRVRPLTSADGDKMRGRSKTQFPVPVCDVAACPRRGERMERTADPERPDKNGKIWKLTMYACRPRSPATSHYAYRALPCGEVVEHIAEGRYRWTDLQTGEVHETVRKKRTIRADRVMPEASCKLHKCLLQQKRGPWRGHGKKKKKKWWTAFCPVGGESCQVDSSGAVLPLSTGAGRGRKPGRPVDPNNQRDWFKVGEAVERLIPIASKDDKIAIVVARRRVTEQTKYLYDTVAKHHQVYRRQLEKHPE